MNSPEPTHPPKPRLALRVGVTGHRADKLPPGGAATLVHRVTEALQEVADVLAAVHHDGLGLGCFDGRPPITRVISALAEGADRLVAEAGCHLGFELQAVLPFPADAYEKDFEEKESRDAFRALLNEASASAVLTLDGEARNPRTDDDAYRACGITVLRQSDVVIALWDGGKARSAAGTGAIVDQALAKRIPVIWIETSHPAAPPRLLVSGGEPPETEPLSELGRRLRELLLPREPAAEVKGRPGWREYFGERWPLLSPLGLVFELFVSVVSWKQGELRLRLPCGRSRLRDGWIPAVAADRPQNAEMFRLLHTHYVWADQLADVYAASYRGSFVLCYALAPFAVLFALVPFVVHGEVVEISCAVIEFVLIAAILVLVSFGRRRCWHDRWLEYRFLAEQLRQMPMLLPLGRIPRSFRAPAHQDYADPETSWASWHFRAVVREAGLFHAILSTDARRNLAMSCIGPSLSQQAEFHERNAQRNDKLARRLHRTHVALFAATILVVLLHVLLALLEHVEPTLLSVMAAVLPAFGAASAGLASQGEFHRMAERSRGMEQRLRLLVGGLETGRPTAADLGDRAEEAANLMLEEVLDWRVLFLGRPLDFPA